jgi:hypothetical protein
VAIDPSLGVCHLFQGQSWSGGLALNAWSAPPMADTTPTKTTPKALRGGKRVVILPRPSVTPLPAMCSVERVPFAPPPIPLFRQLVHVFRWLRHASQPPGERRLADAVVRRMIEEIDAEESEAQ